MNIGKQFPKFKYDELSDWDLIQNQNNAFQGLRQIKREEDMQITEASAAVLAKPSEAPVIREGQTAVNGIGWTVELHTADGWQPIIADWLMTRDEAEKVCDAMQIACDAREFRVYELLEAK
jgi:hypothetical protein